MKKIAITLLLLIFTLISFSFAEGHKMMPIKMSALKDLEEIPTRGCLNLYSLDQLQSAVRDGDENGLLLILTDISTLLDGTNIDPVKIYGTAYVGPYPFEADENEYSYKRFRAPSSIKNGKATLRVGYLLGEAHNSEDWTDHGTVAVRLRLFLEQEGKDRFLGDYDTFTSFKKENDRYIKSTSIIEGPFVNLIQSDNPGKMVISFRTDRPVKGTVILNNGEKFADEKPTTQHEIPVTGLKVDTEYRYRVKAGDLEWKEYKFHTAPEKGKGTFKFAYIGDSREGVGGGERNFMGLNYAILERLLNQAWLADVRFYAMGGDLVNGYTSVKDDFKMQLHGWKQAVAGFRNHYPVYPAMGNHEALLNVYLKEGKWRILLDKWPYETDSAEAVFADEFVNPKNGPKPMDERLPTYEENVFSYQYGPVKMIAFNNNYWISYRAFEYGGCPEGFIMENQLEWIKKEIEAGDRDETVKYMILYAQEPVFPNGGHVKDAMWHGGDNRNRAHIFDPEKKELIPAEKGVIEVRNELARAVAASPKVAAILGSDEHSYHKILITKDVPAGIPEKDDKDENQIIEKEEPVSPLSYLNHPTWYLVCGGGGAPYYSHQDAPWNKYWIEKGKYGKGAEGYFYYSSQANIFLFDVNEKSIGVKVINPYGEMIDEIPDLMKVKNKSESD